MASSRHMNGTAAFYRYGYAFPRGAWERETRNTSNTINPSSHALRGNPYKRKAENSNSLPSLFMVYCICSSITTFSEMKKAVQRPPSESHCEKIKSSGNPLWL